MILAAVSAISLMTGCRTVTVPVSVTAPGEFNLTGVSKIALVDFNSIPDDPLSGVYAADKETISIVQRMVASSFYKTPMYHIADLDLEKEIAAKHSAGLAHRFDAILYGRLWWQVSPERRGTYPHVFTLKTWRNVKYDTGMKNPLSGEPIYQTAEVVQNTRDVLQTLYYRTWNASLMLSLTLYRVDKDGKLEKITDTYAVASQDFQVNNGVFSTKYLPIGLNEESRSDRLKESTEKKSFFDSLANAFGNKENSGSNKLEMVQNTTSIPTELQMKLMLSKELVSILGKKISPSQVVFNVRGRFNDDKLVNLLKNGAFKAAKEYIVYKVRQELGNGISDKIDPVANYDIPRYLVPKADPEKISDEDVKEAADDYRDYLYALGVCEEATGQFEQALYTYRYVFGLSPESEYANGISRCLFALGMNARVKENVKAQKAAERKSSLK